MVRRSTSGPYKAHDLAAAIPSARPGTKECKIRARKIAHRWPEQRQSLGMKADPQIFAYQPKSSHRRHRWFSRIVFLILTLAMLSWWNSATLMNLAARARNRWYVRKCEKYQLQPGTVVFETDPALARAYSGDPRYAWVATDPPYLIRRVPPLDDFPWKDAFASSWDTAAFCHLRVSKSGHRRLVVVDAFLDGVPIAAVIDTGSFTKWPMVISTTGMNTPRPWHKYVVLATPTRGVVDSAFWAAHNNPLFTLYAGQADPIDASHFTFRYVGKGGTGTIDGWLLDNDKVRFRALDGPYSQSLSYFMQMEKESDD
jgi:hypothetical protein